MNIQSKKPMDIVSFYSVNKYYNGNRDQDPQMSFQKV